VKSSVLFYLFGKADRAKIKILITPKATIGFLSYLSAKKPPTKDAIKIPTALAPRNRPFPKGANWKARVIFVADTPAA
jgi:hypothetical protein